MKNSGIYACSSKKRKNKHNLLYWFCLFLVLGSSFYFVGKKVKAYWREKEVLSVSVGKIDYQSQPKDEVVYNRKDYVVQSGDVIIDVFEELGLSRSKAYEILGAAKNIYDLSLIRQGDVFTAYVDKDSGQWIKIKYELDNFSILVISKDNKKIKVQKKEIKYTTSLHKIKGVINDSLYKSAVIDQGLSPKLVVDLAEIFAWDVDFSTDIRKGDSFAVYYEEKQRLDQKNRIITGRILAAEFINQGSSFWAFWYKDPEGGHGYFDKKGNSVEKQFLRSPVQYRYISSGYTNRRYHPILKRYLPHLSIDFVAPTGTPVVTIGDGVVTFAGWKTGWGNAVIVRHNQTYSTRYGHFSGIAKGIKKGVRIKQGQVVGYVGMTGYATGPHLDFTFFKNNAALNPFKATYPSAKPIKKEYLTEYLKRKDSLLKFLD